MNILHKNIEDRRSFSQTWNSEMCHSNAIDRYSNFVHGSYRLSQCRGSDGQGERQYGHERRSKVFRFANVRFGINDDQTLNDDTTTVQSGCDVHNGVAVCSGKSNFEFGDLASGLTSATTTTNDNDDENNDDDDKHDEPLHHHPSANPSTVWGKAAPGVLMQFNAPKTEFG